MATRTTTTATATSAVVDNDWFWLEELEVLPPPPPASIVLLVLVMTSDPNISENCVKLTEPQPVTGSQPAAATKPLAQQCACAATLLAQHELLPLVTSLNAAAVVDGRPAVWLYP
jgi:hypothetical protein